MELLELIIILLIIAIPFSIWIFVETGKSIGHLICLIVCSLLLSVYSCVLGMRISKNSFKYSLIADKKVEYCIDKTTGRPYLKVVDTAMKNTNTLIQEIKP